MKIEMPGRSNYHPDEYDESLCNVCVVSKKYKKHKRTLNETDGQAVKIREALFLTCRVLGIKVFDTGNEPRGCCFSILG